MSTHLRVVGLVCILAACGRQPVAWDPPTTPTLSGVAAPATRGAPEPQPGMCPASVRLAGHPPVLWAAWWTVHPDSSVVLRMARSTDAGSHWEPAIAADTTDRGVRGCARPAPAIAYDADSNWVHLAYFLEPMAGPGVYYEHYMATMFHARVPIVFGERPAAVAVAASHDTVVVAYEDPNRRVSQVAIALSTTAGHLFTIGTPVSGEDVAAYRPAVTLSGDRVAVAWLETASDQGDPAPSDTGRRVTRSGRIE